MGSRNNKKPEKGELKSAGDLKYVDDTQPGYRRKKWGKGFQYFDWDGHPVRDEKLLERFLQLVIPPAWKDVWICADACGHLQATGRDARNRIVAFLKMVCRKSIRSRKAKKTVFRRINCRIINKKSRPQTMVFGADLINQINNLKKREVIMNKEYLSKWLKDAYAMEKAAINILEREVKQMDEFPEIRSRLQEHLQESQWQADEVKKCLDRLGEKPSKMKDITAKFMGNMSTLTNATAEDEPIKNFIANASFENLEIASYRSLIETAKKLNEKEIQNTLEGILRQEEEMARWVQNQVPTITATFLSTHA